MNKIIMEERGRSMIEMLGVLAVIGVLTVAAFFGYQKASTKSRINKTVEAAALALQRYADFTLKNTKDVHINGEEAVTDASTFGLADTCRLLDSEAETGYKVCDVPLGELYLKFEDMGNKTYNYMLFVTLVSQDAGTCTSFLTQGWNQIIPNEWWPNTAIWVMSDAGEATVYPEGTNTVTPTDIGNACTRICSDEEYCVVVFDFGGIQGGM